MGAKADETRKKLLQGAMIVLTSEGVASTTTRKIAEASGQRLASMHYHFRDKDALLFDVMQELNQQQQQFLDDQVRPGGDLDARIEGLIRTVWQLVRNTASVQILQFELTLYAARGAETVKLAEIQYEGLVDQYRRILSFGLEDQLAQEGWSVVSRLCLAGLDGLILQQLAQHNDIQSARMLDALILATQAVAKSLSAD